jgi:hypothetical protein
VNAMNRKRSEIDPTIVSLISRVKERISATRASAGEMRAQWEVFENQFNNHDLLWHWFEMILHHPKDPSESILERLAFPPAESADVEIVAMWAALTDPGRIAGLEVRASQPGINPHARDMTLTALATARRRLQE